MGYRFPAYELLHGYFPGYVCEQSRVTLLPTITAMYSICITIPVI